MVSTRPLRGLLNQRRVLFPVELGEAHDPSVENLLPSVELVETRAAGGLGLVSTRPLRGLLNQRGAIQSSGCRPSAPILES